jgi:hypothetical protein
VRAEPTPILFNIDDNEFVFIQHYPENRYCHKVLEFWALHVARETVKK